VEKTAKSHNI